MRPRPCRAPPASSASPCSADASSTRPFRNVRRIPETGRGVELGRDVEVGSFPRRSPRSASRRTRRRACSRGRRRLRPCGREATGVRSVSVADDPHLVGVVEPGAAAAASTRLPRPSRAGTRRRSSPRTRVSGMPASWAYALVGNWQPTHGISSAIVRRKNGAARFLHQRPPFGVDLAPAAGVVGRLDRDPRVHVVGGVEVDRRDLADELRRRLGRPRPRRSGRASSSSAGAGTRRASAISRISSSTSGRASGCVLISTCQPGCTSSDRSTSSGRTRSTRGSRAPMRRSPGRPAPSSSIRPPCRSSLTMSQWTALLVQPAGERRARRRPRGAPSRRSSRRRAMLRV